MGFYFFLSLIEEYLYQTNIISSVKQKHIIIIYNEDMKAEMKGQSAITHTILLNGMKFTTWTIILVNPFSTIVSRGMVFI